MYELYSCYSTLYWLDILHIGIVVYDDVAMTIQPCTVSDDFELRLFL